ncbi:MAG TPA: hypothetical protein VFK48_10745 [Usitatibacter sp.]|nr:hypothetical protein [Usitatibacter sp.]
MKKFLPGVLCAAFLAAACAAPQASTEPAAERGEYRTGSNIPRKPASGPDRVEKLSPEEFERARERMGTPGMAGGR